MKHAMKIIASLCVLSLCGPATPQATTSPQAPVGWYGFSPGTVAAGFQYGNGFVARAAPIPSAKCVYINYMPPVSVKLQRAANGLPAISQQVQINTWYWPVAVDWTEGGTGLVVAGLSPRDGVTTVVETWKFSDIDPSTTTHVLSTGVDELVWTVPKHESVNLVLYKDLGIGSPIAFINQNKGLNGSHFFVGFRGHNTVYSMDIKVGDLTPVASPSAGMGLIVPELADFKKDFCSTYNHTTVGYVYRIFDAEGPSLYLIDTNRDGILDDYDHAKRNPNGMNRFTRPSPNMLPLH